MPPKRPAKNASVPVLIGAVLVIGCPQKENPKAEAIQDTDVGYVSSTGAPSAEDAGADETGPVQGTDTDDDLIPGCRAKAVEGEFGFVHQCEGGWGVEVRDDAGLLFDDFGLFGDGIDEYARPTVMACCDVYEEPPPPQPHFHHCYKDGIETMCNTVASWVKTATTGIAGSGAAIEAAGKAANCKAAINAVIDDTSTWDPDAPPSTGLEATWTIGSFGCIAGNCQMDNLRVDFELGINDVFIPESGDDYLECVDNNFNLGETYLSLADDPEFETLLEEGDGVLVGPVYDQSRMSATPVFASEDTQCVAPLCSRMSFSDNGTDWTLDDLVLYSSDEVVISDGDDLNYTADWLTIELVGDVTGTEVSTNKFEIAQGDAFFKVNGVLQGLGGHVVTGWNVSKITVEKRGSMWQTHSFSIDYKDDDGDTWTLTVGRADWD